jgi:hypothetical protein
MGGRGLESQLYSIFLKSALSLDSQKGEKWHIKKSNLGFGEIET